jgi:hypothetical protein
MARLTRAFCDGVLAARRVGRQIMCDVGARRAGSASKFLSPADPAFESGKMETMTLRHSEGKAWVRTFPPVVGFDDL